MVVYLIFHFFVMGFSTISIFQFDDGEKFKYISMHNFFEGGYVCPIFFISRRMAIKANHQLEIFT